MAEFYKHVFSKILFFVMNY